MSDSSMSMSTLDIEANTVLDSMTSQEVAEIAQQFPAEKDILAQMVKIDSAAALRLRIGELAIERTSTVVSPEIAVSSDVEEMDLTNQAEVTNNKKGTNMVFMFLREFVVIDENDKLKHCYYTIITSVFRDEDEERAYFSSLEHNRVVDGVFAIRSGNYRFRLMEELMVRKGFQFRGVMMESRDLKHIDFVARAEKVTAAWATDSKGFFLSVMPADVQYMDNSLVSTEFGFDMLGLKAEYTKKLTKRLQEIFRSSEKSIFMEHPWEVCWTTVGALALVGPEQFQDPNQVVIAEFRTPEFLIAMLGKEEADKLFDGISLVDAKLILRALKEQPKSKSVRAAIKRVKKAIREQGSPEDIFISREIFRLLGEKGLIKGDCLVIVGLKARTGADVVYHTENLKKELSTDGFTVITFETHNPLHSTTLDQQTMINLKPAMTRELVDHAILRLWREAKDNIQGELPDWMTFKAQDFTTKLGVTGPESSLDASLKDYERWVSYDPEYFTVDMAQNYGSMWMGSIVKKMRRAYNQDTRLNKKAWIPAVNTVSMGVMTNSALKLMAGYDPEVTEGLSYLENVGVIFPDNRWLECYDLFGGYDLDDTINAMKVAFWSSNSAHLDNLRADGIIDPSIEVPSTKEDAVELALCWRMPNGPGEYSIHRTQDMLPYANTKLGEVDDEPVHVIDIATMPRGQKYLLSLCTEVGEDVPTDPALVYSTKEAPVFFGRQHAVYMLEAQSTNPTIGAVANALMVWSDAMGVSYPNFMLTKLENMVDAVQAGHDKVSIAAVKEAAISMMTALADIVEVDNTVKVDRMLVTERLRSSTGEYMDVLRTNMVDRQPTVTAVNYMKACGSLQKIMKDRLLQARQATPLAKKVLSFRFRPEVKQWAAAKFTLTSKAMREVDRVNKVDPQDHTFLKMTKRYAAAEASQKVISDLVADIESDPAQARFRAVAMYQVALEGNQKWENGFYDRVIFQSAGNERAVFDILAEAALTFR